VVWFAPDASASSVFVPFFSTTLAYDAPFDREAYGEGSQKSFSFLGSKLPPAWWAFDFVANWMELSYKNMSETYVYPKVQKLQNEVADEVQAALNSAANVADGEVVAKMLGQVQTRIQRRVTEEWWALAGMLVVRYNDYFFNWPEEANDTVQSIGYPAFWLEQIGYNMEFYKPHWVQPSNAVPRLLPDEQKAILGSAGARHADAVGAWPLESITMPLTMSTAWACSVFLAYVWGRRTKMVENQGLSYAKLLA